MICSAFDWISRAYPLSLLKCLHRRWRKATIYETTFQTVLPCTEIAFRPHSTRSTNGWISGLLILWKCSRHKRIELKRAIHLRLLRSTEYLQGIEDGLFLKPLQPTRSEGVRVRLNQKTSVCQRGCQCACHASRTSATPALVDRVLGQLFIGYTGLPFLSAKCNVEDCEKSQSPHVSLEYWFPLGFFWSQIVRLQVNYQANVGPQVALSTLRRIPDSAQCVNFALNGNIDGLKDLFVRGLAFTPRC